MGSGFGSDIGQHFLGPFASTKPKQTSREFQMVDPYASMPNQKQYTEDILTGNLASPTSAGGNPFVGPRPEQERSLAALEKYQGQAEPLYGQGVRTLKDEAAGKYLDVASRPEFAALSKSRQDIAKMLFQDAMNDTNARAAARGNYNSSVREAQLGRQAGRVGTEAAHDIAQAGWTQYGAERGLQHGAAQFGAQLAPSLAGQVFGAGEQLRSAEQAGNTAAMEAQLRAAGMDQGKIGLWLEYMRMAKPEMLPSVVGPSPLDENRKTLSTEASAFGSVMGGMKGA
jgi:hypothetical protein